MILLFKLMMLCAPVSFVLYMIESVRGTVSLRTRWSQLNRYQWCLVAGTAVGCLGFFGLLVWRMHFA